ncbi:MAG TPA: 2Fe-2S iron-sulfur cluster binding domain-containing protein, partial [Chloroflexi bacterium]|nr:2Fe-2S iron-sulfur cluster binding domain-containing protein [Chloroflexota bacterium]
SPQIRNRGTVAGNLITASPANDTITPLMALDARVTLRSTRGERTLPLREFYTGVRRTVMQPDEMLVDIAFPALRSNQKGVFLKLGLRRAQAISVVNAAVVLTMQGDKVQQAAVTLGAVAPTIIHARKAEAYLTGRTLSPETTQAAADLAREAATPIDDVRASAAYRLETTRVLVFRALEILAGRRKHDGVPGEPVLLWGADSPWERTQLQTAVTHQAGTPIKTRINGREYIFTTGQEKSLLHLLRDEAGLFGPKEGCGEGECGACTVYLDGVAVMSCLVPASRAHGAEIVTVEGLAHAERLHPIQEAFVHDGAVQCGYCTPGFLMSAAKLLEEKPDPSRQDIQTALTGNLCRCTGYYKIVQAVEDAAHMQKERAR